jgi:hydroxymethylpyrimidine/phosphomethylpyrimidine kinase
MSSVALTIAGSDPSGGAGLQADLKTFHQHGVYGMAVVTLLTVQNTQTVSQVHVQPPRLVLDQLDAVLADIQPSAAKTGALGNPEVVEAIAKRAADFNFPLIIDPVMISKHGAQLIDPGAAEVLIGRLMPRAFLITPNLQEAAALSGRQVEDEEDMAAAAHALALQGARNVLIKGGHLADAATDMLLADGRLHRFAGPRLSTPHTHGTGCVYSAAITARLARGESLVQAVAGAKRFVTAAIRSNPGLGHGLGPTNLFVDADPQPMTEREEDPCDDAIG